MSRSTSVAPSAPRRSRRFRLGVGLLALAFLPAGLKVLTPALWVTIPTAAQWMLFAASGLCTIGVTALIITADDGTRAAPGEAMSGEQ